MKKELENKLMRIMITILSLLFLCSCKNLNSSLIAKNECNQNKRYKGQLHAKEAKLREHILLIPKITPKEESF